MVAGLSPAMRTNIKTRTMARLKKKPRGNWEKSRLCIWQKAWDTYKSIKDKDLTIVDRINMTVKLTGFNKTTVRRIIYAQIGEHNIKGRENANINA